jgi:hypothetical protein
MSLWSTRCAQIWGVFFYTGNTRIIVGFYRDWFKGLPGRRPKLVTSDISDGPLSNQSSSKHLRLSRCLLLSPLGSKLKMKLNVTDTKKAASTKVQNSSILRRSQIKISIVLSEASLLYLCPCQTQLRFWHPLVQHSGWTLHNMDKELRLLTCSVYSKVPVIFLLLSFSWNDVDNYRCFWTKYCKANG